MVIETCHKMVFHMKHPQTGGTGQADTNRKDDIEPSVELVSSTSTALRSQVITSRVKTIQRHLKSHELLQRRVTVII